MLLNIANINVSQVYLPDCYLRHICDIQAVEDSPQDAKPFMDEVDPSGREDKVDSDILEALLGGTIGCATLGPKGDSPIISVEPGTVFF